MTYFPIALTIAGSDPSGGAGIQADLKVFQQFEVRGTSVITLLTAQDSRKVSAVELVRGDFVRLQLDTILSEGPPRAVKTGALGSAEIVEIVASRLKNSSQPLVLDPIISSSNGAPLLERAGFEAFISQLLPLGFLVMPNIAEAEALAGTTISNVFQMRSAAEIISRLGVTNVLITGGHLAEKPIDVLYHNGDVYEFPSERLHQTDTHGTGCVFSAAVAACLARGLNLIQAIKTAKNYISEAIRLRIISSTGGTLANTLVSTGLDFPSNTKVC